MDLVLSVNEHPFELCENIPRHTYCSFANLEKPLGKEVVICGLVVEQRTHNQITGEAMKFLTLADWTGIVETELSHRR